LPLSAKRSGVDSRGDASRPLNGYNSLFRTAKLL
jgi:hypothetical protein